MHIDAYEFGRMVVDGKPYRSDVILVPERVIGDWRRVQGHSLAVEDLKDLTGCPLRLLIVGTGMYGRMQVPPETVQYLEKKGIEPLIQNTPDATRSFNAQVGKGGVAGAFHLTC